MKTHIDPTTPATWAASIVARVHEATVDGFGLCDDGTPYDLHNFLCDMWVGNVPWNRPGHRAVVAAMRAHPDFAATMAAFQAKYGVDYMEGANEDDGDDEEELFPNGI